MIGIAGVYVKEQRYNAEYNRPQSQYGVMEYAQKRDSQHRITTTTLL